MNTFHAGLDGVIIDSKGSKLLGGLYRAAGVGPRPTALLLHGIPGVEKNLDMAYALRDVGWNCLYFHYRGCWGSEGSYSLTGALDDIHFATEWVIQQPSVDAKRLALIGMSGGGYLALKAGAMDLQYQIIVALCPLTSPKRNPIPLEVWSEFTPMLHGISGEQLKSQYDELSPIESLAEELRNRPVLILTGGIDELFPPSHYLPLIESVPTIEWYELKDGDHALSLCWQETVRRTVDWLVTHLGQ